MNRKARKHQSFLLDVYSALNVPCTRTCVRAADTAVSVTTLEGQHPWRLTQISVSLLAVTSRCAPTWM